MSYVNRDSYMVIQGWMLTELGLKGNELLVYAIIYGYSQDGASEFSGSLKYLAEWTGACKNTIINTLAALEGKGLVTKRHEVINGVTLCKYAAELVRGCKNCTGGGAKIAPNNINNNLVNNTPPTPPRNKTQKTTVAEGSELESLEAANLPKPVAAQLTAWLRYKRERRECYTPTGLATLLTVVGRRTSEHGAEAVAGVIADSIANGWRGICWDKLPKVAAAPQPRTDAFAPPPGWREQRRARAEREGRKQE